MNLPKSKTDSVSADKSAIGFDYQYYFFLWKLLSIRTGQTVGLECKDDVHTDLDNDIQILYQLKHTVQKSSATQNLINLTTLDSDLWKTISNWSEIICDTNAGRSSIEEQSKFVKKTLFVLASNKSHSNRNLAIKHISNLNNKIDDVTISRGNFKKIKDSTSDNSIKSYIEIFLNLKDKILEEFINNISFQLEEDDVLTKCRLEIKSKMVPENRINQVFRDIDSQVKEDNFIKIKEGIKIEISFDEFYCKYRRYYELARNEKLQIHTFNEQLPDNLEQQIFIRQLLEIEDFQVNDIETIAELTTYKLKLKRNVNTWVESGDITNKELGVIQDNSLIQWKNIFRKNYRKLIPEDKHNEKGIEIIDKIRDIYISFPDLPDDLSLSNGYYYYLSDIPVLGWRTDWDKYKND